MFQRRIDCLHLLTLALSLAYNGVQCDSRSKCNRVRAFIHHSAETRQYCCLQPLSPHSRHSPGCHVSQKTRSRQSLTFKLHHPQLHSHQIRLERCILDDCKLANSSIYNSSFSCSRSKCTVSPLPYFNRIPPEIRDKTFSEAMEWNGKISVLIAALRGDPVLYHEALRILSKKGGFEFHSGNTQTRNMALPSSFKGMERVRSSKYLLLAIL